MLSADTCQNLLRFSVSASSSIRRVPTPPGLVRILRTIISIPSSRVKTIRSACVCLPFLFWNPTFWNPIRAHYPTHRVITCWSNPLNAFFIPTSGNDHRRSGAPCSGSILCRHNLTALRYRSKWSQAIRIVSWFAFALVFSLTYA